MERWKDTNQGWWQKDSSNIQAKIIKRCSLPIARMKMVQLMIVVVAQNHWKIHQIDVKSAFLNGPLEEEVFVKQPPSFVKQGSEDKVCKLKRRYMV